MYKIFCDNKLICDSRIDTSIVINPVVTLEMNTAGTFTFTFPATHDYINYINRMSSVIRVERDDELIFQGFCVSEKTDMFGNKAVSCEGELSYFNDSVLRPAKYQGETVLSLLTKYITQHNAQVEERKRFEVGTVTVSDPNDYIFCYTNMNSTMQEIKEDLLDDYGGYMRVRYANGKKYIDYLVESTKNASQVISLGENLIDYNSNIDDNKIATRVIPLGNTKETEEIEGLSTRIDIKSVNDGKDYLDSDLAIANFGILTKVVTYNGVNDPSILKAKGEKWLRENQFENVVIEVSAVDIAMLGMEQHFQLFDRVRIISEYHGMDRWFTLTKMQLNLNNPENDTYTLGKQQQLTLSAKSTKLSASTREINAKINEAGWLKKAKEQATALISGVDGGYVVMNVDNNGIPFEILVMDAPFKETATKVWRWNQNGFGYSSTGYDGPYGTAITMDGTIVADYIKAGIISGVEINNGNGTFRVDSNGNLTANSGTFKGTVATRSGNTWLNVESGNIDGGSNYPTQHGYINFTFAQEFPEGIKDGILMRTPAIGLKGRLATNPNQDQVGNVCTLRNVIVGFSQDLITGQLTPFYRTVNPDGTYSEPTTFSFLNFVNGFLVAIDTFYPL